MNWITKNISEALSNFVSGALGFFDSAMTYVFDRNIEIFTSSEITKAEMIIKPLAIVLVIIMVLKEIFTTYVTETDGDPDSDPMQLFTRASIVLAVIEGNSLLFDVLQEISRKLTTELVGACSARQFTVKMSSLIQNMVFDESTAAVLIVLCAVILIMMIIFVIKSGIRGGEIMIARLLLPIFAVDLVKTNSERWNAFITNYIVTFVSYSLQLFLIRCGINRVISALSEGMSATFLNYFAGVTLFFLAIKTPKWLEKFVYSSGIGQMAGNTGRSLMYMIPTAMARR